MAVQLRGVCCFLIVLLLYQEPGTITPPCFPTDTLWFSGTLYPLVYPPKHLRGDFASLKGIQAMGQLMSLQATLQDVILKQKLASKGHSGAAILQDNTVFVFLTDVVSGFPRFFVGFVFVFFPEPSLPFPA